MAALGRQHQLNDSIKLLHRPVESAARSGRSLMHLNDRFWLEKKLSRSRDIDSIEVVGAEDLRGDGVAGNE